MRDIKIYLCNKNLCNKTGSESLNTHIEMSYCNRNEKKKTDYKYLKYMILEICMFLIATFNTHITEKLTNFKNTFNQKLEYTR